MYISVNEQSLTLKGYSRTTNFTLNNLKNDYTSFQIRALPENEFIIIPENGALLPDQQKTIKIYLSRNSMKKETIQNCSIVVTAWKINQGNILKNNSSPPQKLILPIYVNNQYSLLKTDLRSNSQGSRNMSSKYGSFHQPSQGNILKSKRSKNDSSMQSSISLHSSHELEMMPTQKVTKFPSPDRSNIRNGTNQFMNQEKFMINAMMKTALSTVQLSDRFKQLSLEKQQLMQQQMSLKNRGFKIKDNNIEFIILCLYLSFCIIIGSYIRILFKIL